MPKPAMREVMNSSDMSTVPQQNFLACLFIDCGFDRQQRNAWLTREFSREVKYLDELRKSEASKAIETLKEMKEEKAEAAKTDKAGWF